MRIIIYTSLIYLLFTVTSLPQQPNFLPLEIGNEYQFNNENNYWYGVIKRDTLYPSGKLYLSLPYDLFYFGDTRIDSNSNILSASKPFFINGDPEEYLLFKSNAQWGEVWPVAWNYNVVIDTGYARCIYDDSLYVFGEKRRVKGTLIFDKSYQYYYFWLAEGIGLIREQFDDGTVNNLNYAKINGVIYGNLVGIDDDENINQLSFSVSQNYPNPFNPETKINYVIKETGFVQLTVYNVLGQTVKELVNEIQSAGSYSVNFNAADLPSGVYMYKLKSGEYLSSKKMMLMK